MSSFSAADIGNTIPVFPFRPNWSTPVADTLQWRTDVHRAYAGNEQRVCLRAKPRRRIEYRAAVWGEERQRFENLLRGYQKLVFGLPLWHQGSRLTAQASAGATVISIPGGDWGDRRMRDGLALLLYRDYKTWEVVTEQSRAGGDITLNASLGRTWPAGSLLYPVVVGKLPEEVSAERLTGDVLDAVLAWTLDPRTASPTLPTSLTWDTYAGYPVVKTQPNWVRPVTRSFRHAFDTFDTDTGVVEWTPTEALPHATRRYSWTLRSNAQVLDFLAFLDRCKGRLSPFLAPEWSTAFEVVADNTADTTKVRVRNNRYLADDAFDATNDRFYIRKSDGSEYFRQAVGAEALPGGILELTLNTATPVTPETVIGFTPLQLCRFDSDSLTLAWETDVVCTVEATLLSVDWP